MSEPSDGDKGSEALSVEKPATSATSLNSPTSRTNFPIEGESKWVFIMRMIAMMTIAILLIIGGGYQLFGSDSSFIESQQILFVCGGIVLILLAEYFVFLKIVIPRQANYGRYVVNQEGVTYYPLSTLGFSCLENPEEELISKFMGITTRKIKSKKNDSRYAVYLVHKTDKGKTINLTDFSNMQEASQFATILAQDLGIAVALR